MDTEEYRFGVGAGILDSHKGVQSQPEAEDFQMRVRG